MGRIACAIVFLTLTFGASFCRADCEHTAYAYEDRVVVQSGNKAGVRETAKFHYELAWTEKISTGEVLHRQYLRKVDAATQQTASEMFLGKHLETID